MPAPAPTAYPPRSSGGSVPSLPRAAARACLPTPAARSSGARPSSWTSSAPVSSGAAWDPRPFWGLLPLALALLKRSLQPNGMLDNQPVDGPLRREAGLCHPASPTHPPIPASCTPAPSARPNHAAGRRPLAGGTDGAAIHRNPNRHGGACRTTAAARPCHRIVNEQRSRRGRGPLARNRPSVAGARRANCPAEVAGGTPEYASIEGRT